MPKNLPQRRPAAELLREFLATNNIEILVIPPSFGVSPEGFFVATSQSRIKPVYTDELPQQEDHGTH